MAKILIVEDQSMLQSLYRALLTPQGFEIEIASNYQEGLQKTESFKPDLMVMDVNLPDGFGLDLCQFVKKTYPGVLVVIVSALGGSVDMAAGLKMGADDYISKPYNVREFISRVKALLRSVGKI